ncbi:hypothetical protein ACWD3J_25490 [Streptomyces sp. NPDC002755]
MGQDHFATVDTDRHLTYETAGPGPHRIRIAFPPEDGEPVRRCLFAAVPLMGCEVLRVTTSDGLPLPGRNASTDEARFA